MARRALRVLDDAFVPNERKAEVRRRLARLKGQLEGVDRMLDQNRPCVENLTQISAAQQALRGAGKVMVRNYLEQCAKKAAKETGEKAGRLRCSLTGKVVDKCCCEPRESGKMHCTLAKKDVDKCCCTEVKAEGKDAK